MSNKLSRLLAGYGNTVDENEEKVAAAVAILTQQAAHEDEDDEKAADEDEEKKTPVEDEDEEKAAEDEDEEEKAADEDEEEKASSATAGTQSAKGRIKAILRAPEAKGHRALAEYLALETGLSAAASIAALKASSGTGSGRLAAAMAQASQPNLGPGGPGGGSDEVTAAANRLAGYVNLPTRAA